MLRLALISAIVYIVSCSSPPSDSFDPLNSHDGIFRPLHLTQSELRLVSRLHATASYHELFDFIMDRLRVMPTVTLEEKRRIEKFLLKNRPPSAFKGLLDEADRNYIAVLHARRDNDGIAESMGIVEKAILRLPQTDRRRVVEYIWKDPEPFMLEHFGLEP